TGRMRRSSSTLILIAATTLLAPARQARAHATYNVSGYGSGLAGSTNGADGSPTAAPAATWTNGPVAEYTGSLPVTWYGGVHHATPGGTHPTRAGRPPP